MKKLTLTLFLALASLVSFGQSTVQTIRLANAATDIGVNIPEGTIVVDVTNKNLYVATAAVAKNLTITTGLSNALFTKINGSIYSVIKEDDVTITEANGGEIIVLISETETPDGKNVVITNSDFKVYLNGALLRKEAYTYVLDTDNATDLNQPGIKIVAAISLYDQVSVVYNTIK
jgi:alpha-L-arabinofuranosidase